ncbi:FkbM family methyltransferase [Algoriphagus mannitolivorans]|uniref:FkbM family methyltransferase n=1 Tax=Algoriphagus mannitolivorans TaxID=226504 RepID=UPI00047B4881|nr:FkbM family methyltransferase [Algoriphagus mannitolivorans]
MVKSLIKSFVDKLTPARLKHYYRSDIERELLFGTISYSQEGEDLLLQRIFENKASGFYVDVGAHHPERFSNTYLFYKKGWRGINIDAMPGSMRPFEELRPDDVNLEVPISDKAQKLLYYVFDEKALNSFSGENAEKYILNGYKVEKKIDLFTKRLDEVLDKYLSDGQTIDFLSIDVEGLDYQVLCSNDWKKYRPKIVLIEELASKSSVEFPKEGLSYRFMEENGYKLFAKTLNTLFFKDNLNP